MSLIGKGLNMIENESFVPTLECWIARLEMLKMISLDFGRAPVLIFQTGRRNMRY